MVRRTTSLSGLATMSPVELAAEWERVHGSPPPSLTPVLLRLAIGYRLQEKAQGGLAAAVTRELARVAAAPAPAPARGSLASRSAPVSPGTRLVRTWGGRTIEVLALEDGFLFDGQTYASLTSIAVAVTGARWSGPRFFGLTRHA
jgi:hypothetical protein